jgi:hypothetical protein
MDPALVLALFERLTGYPLDSTGRPMVDPATGRPVNRHGSYGIRFPTPRETVSSTALSTDNPSALRLFGRGFHSNVYNQVPVFMEGPDSVRFEDVWPCVSFVESDIVPNAGDPFVYYDPIVDRSGSATVTNDVNDYELTGADQIITRAHPEPFLQMVTIKVYSKDPVERTFINRAVLHAMKTKSAISVEQGDGSFRMIDYFLDRVAYFDQGEAFSPNTATGPTHDRYLCTAFTYMFETHLDNSVQGFGTLDIQEPQDTILHRILEIRGHQERLFDGRVDLEGFRP